MSEEYHSLEPFRILFLNVYPTNFIRYHVSPIPSERIDTLLKSRELHADAKASISEEDRNQAQFVWDMSDCFHRSLFESLNTLSIPSEAQTIPVVCETEPLIFSDSQFESKLKNFMKDFDAVVVASSSEILNKISSMPIIALALDAKVPQNESLKVFSALWHKVGDFCLERGYVEDVSGFSHEAVEETIRTHELKYLSRNGEHLSEPTSGAFAIIPNFKPAVVDIIE